MLSFYPLRKGPACQTKSRASLTSSISKLVPLLIITPPLYPDKFICFPSPVLFWGRREGGREKRGKSGIRGERRGTRPIGAVQVVTTVPARTKIEALMNIPDPAVDVGSGFIK